MSIVVAGGAASAQPAVADALFTEGRELMDAGDFARACPKLAESQHLDPATGTLLNLGLCYQKAGKTASAWLTFKDAIVSARRENRPERVAYAEKQVAELQPSLSFLTVTVGPEDSTGGLKVEVDGVKLVTGAWGTPIPMDPGKVRVRATAPSRRAWEVEIQLGDKGDTQSVAIPPLQPDSSTDPVHRSVVDPPKADEGAEDQGQANLGYLIGGAGVLALGVGSYFGLRALSRWDERNAHCVDGCDAEAVTFGEDADRYGTIANVGIGLGVVGVGLGTYFLITSPSTQTSKGKLHVDPIVARQAAGVIVGGAW